MPYDPKRIEPKWQRYWEENATFEAEVDLARPKFYVLDMFPYPSGEGLHVGHPEGYTATDIVARYKRMRGFNVLHPMGWDAYGLPAERYAVRTGVHPVDHDQNEHRDISAVRSSGSASPMTGAGNWRRPIPDYIRWTQWIFLKLFERGLAYQAEVAVNWCPAQGTVLANEEVKDGKYVETGEPVERRLMRQWMLKITAYADRLLDDLDELDWPDGIKAMQRNWIGRSEGAEITFALAGSSETLTVYTTRPDTIWGATFLVLSPEHPLVAKVTTSAQRSAVDGLPRPGKVQPARWRGPRSDPRRACSLAPSRSTRPMALRIPIWIADYVADGLWRRRHHGGAWTRQPRPRVRPHLWPAHRRSGQSAGEL